MFVLAACSGAPATTPTPTAAPTTAATVASTGVPSGAPATTAPVDGATGPALENILGEAPPAEPAGTSWIRITEDNHAFSFEVPSTWTDHRTAPWPEADGSSSGTVVLAGTHTDVLGTDFSAPGVAIGVTANPSGRSASAVVGADDYTASCTGSPIGTEDTTVYSAAYRVWTECDASDAFLIVVVVNPTGSKALFVVVFQGTTHADLGYVKHILASVQTGSTAPTPTTPAGNGQGWTIRVDMCFSQINDAIAEGTITNVDTRSHSYRVIVRFTTAANTLIGEDYWDTPAIDPGQGYQYEVRHMALNGITEFRCTVSDVLIRN